MANFYTDIGTTYNSPASGYPTSIADRAEGQLTSGNLHAIKATYTTTTGTDETASDFIYVARGIVGAELCLTAGHIWVESGTSTALAGTLGYNFDSSTTDDPDLLSDAMTLDSEGKVDFVPNDTGEAFYTITEEGWIYFDLTTVTSIVASKKIQFYIPFTLNV